MTRLKALLCISIFVFIYAVYYWVVPAVVDIQHRVPFIQSVVKKQLGAEIELKNPSLKMGLIPSIWLEASYFGVKGKKGEPLSVVNPKLKIRLLPLIFGKVNIAYFSCDKINAKLRVDKNYHFYVGDYLILKNANPIVSIEDSQMDINSYEFKLKDEIQNKNILIKGDYFNLEKYNSQKQIKLSTNSDFNIDGRHSVINADVDFKLPLKKGFDTNEIVFDGMVTNLNLGDFSPYIKKLSNDKVKRTAGVLNINTVTKVLNNRTTNISTQMALQNLFIEGKDKASSIYFKNKLNIYSNIDISKNTLDIKKLQILSGSIKFGLGGTVNKVSSNNPTLDLSVTINKSRVEDFIALLPAQNIKSVDLNLPALKKYGYYGDIEGKLSIKGKSNKPVLSGEFVSKNGYVIKPLPSDVPKATVTLKFLGNKMILDVLVYVSKNEKVSIKGPIELYGDKKSTLDILSTSNVNLSVTESILNPMHEIFYFEIGPVPVMKLQGFGNINLKVNGTKLKPHLLGVFNFRNATASFNGIDMVLKNADGSLYFQDTDTHFITKKASLDGKSIKVDGKCSLDGVLDFDIIANGQDLNTLVKVLENSPMLKDIQKRLPEIKHASGKINAKIKLYGKVKNIDDFSFGKTIFLAGNIKMLGNNFSIEGIKTPIKNLYGDINFKNDESDFDMHSSADNSKIYVKGKIKNDTASLEVKGNLKNNTFNLNGTVKNILQKNQVVNAKFISDNFDVSALKDLVKYAFVKDNAINYINKISNPSGHVSLRATIKNNVLYSKLKLHDLSFSFSDIPMKIFSGSLELNKDKLTLYNANAIIDSMPILLDGTIANVFTNPNFNLYINSKPTQKFIEKYINKNATYPLKIKGDIIYSTRVHGTKDSFSAKTEVNMQDGANIYYMGSTLGDANDPIRIFADTNVSKNSVFVNNFQYDKLISSQNAKEFVSPQLNAKGQITFVRNNIKLSNFWVKTQNPTDAKIFNLLFKKPMIKQGQFSSNVFMNGPITSPKLQGTLNFTGIDIPLLDTTIKDISLDFGPQNIDIKSKGEIFANQIILFANMKNRLEPPYIINDADIYLGNLDINQIIKSLNKIQIETPQLTEQTQGFDIGNLIIKKAKLKADSVFVKNIFAQNLLAEFSLSEKLLFSLDNFKFNMAQGTVNGDFKYNFLNSSSAIDLHVDKANANSMAEALFDLPNQIFGSLTGRVELTCNGRTHKTCMDTLSGNGGFVVADGRMPKLGSLEYLLKASNVVKSGVTGVTINGLIDLISPLKTGEFESINGSFSIKTGLADSIQIFSKGKDLSLFLTGTYNFSTIIADMKVFGRLSKKITNVLGPVGNTSLNTIFNTLPGLHLEDANKAEFINSLNKIPGFELNDKTYRIFSAEIYGDINGDNYVQSFKWVE